MQLQEDWGENYEIDKWLMIDTNIPAKNTVRIFMVYKFSWQTWRTEMDRSLNSFS